MPFPEAPRVVYGKKPLKRVICQLRFPPILRIDTSLPVDFQERIRGDFPNFAENSDVRIQIPAEVGQLVPSEVLREILQSSSTKNYAFASADGSSVLNLTRTFFALTATTYETWERFRERLLRPFRSLVEIYHPDYLTRIGLRYVDVFVRSEVGLSDVPWRDLLSSALIGFLGQPNTADFVESFESTSEIRLTNEGSRARIIAKLGKVESGQEDAFTVDSDFFRGRTEVDSAFERLDHLHSYATRLVRWAITERLHQAMEPTPL